MTKARIRNFKSALKINFVHWQCQMIMRDFKWNLVCHPSTVTGPLMAYFLEKERSDPYISFALGTIMSHSK